MKKILIYIASILAILSSCTPSPVQNNKDYEKKVDSLAAFDLATMSNQISILNTKLAIQDSMIRNLEPCECVEIDLTEVNNHLNNLDEISSDIYRKIRILYRNDSSVLMYCFNAMAQMNSLYGDANNLQEPGDSINEAYIIIYHKGIPYRARLIKED